MSMEDKKHFACWKYLETVKNFQDIEWVHQIEAFFGKTEEGENAIIFYFDECFDVDVHQNEVHKRMANMSKDFIDKTTDGRINLYTIAIIPGESQAIVQFGTLV